MKLEIEFLKQLAIDIYNAVHPLLGKKESGKKISKGAGGDISMQIDLLAENTLIDSLEKSSKHLLLISEEIGEKFIGKKEIAINNKQVLIVDPIDGSNNAARGIPYCSVSIAYAIGDTIKDIQKAVVLDLSTKDIYWAVKGKGAYLNDVRIKVSELSIKDQCFFELNVSKKSMFRNIDRIRNIITKFYRTRILGSSALTLCQIAKGSMDAFLNLRETNRLVDVAAGMLILSEAGGTVFNLDGSEIQDNLSIDSKFPFIASNLNLAPFLKRSFSKLSI